jgi:crotonobetainyl-CoA:carnitine CoA-transferase CaiB-like acyl-CoA transferase
MILEGVRWVELTAWVAGPAAAGVLADWGADVVKVEPPSGDPQRSIFGAIGAREQTSVPPFELDNRGKRSVVLDLRAESGQEAMEKPLARADVFVTNMRVAALTRRGLDPAAVRARHPSIVYGIITGYGLDGPDAHRPGYDVGAFWARSTLLRRSCRRASCRRRSAAGSATT